MLYIFIAMIFYTAATMFGTLASRNANTNLVSAVMNIVSAILPIAVAFPHINQKMWTDSKLGVIAAIAGGVCIAIFALAINKSYSLNKVGIVAPMIFGGSILLSTILSLYFFKEKVSWYQGMGLAFVMIGLSFITYAKMFEK